MGEWLDNESASFVIEDPWCYWQRMVVTLDAPIGFDETLKDGFWPTTRVAPSFEDKFTETGNV